MRICPKCRTTYPKRTQSTCPVDGAKLVEQHELAQADADPLLGRTIAGRFKIVERVGTGGMGTVYRAEQSGLDRDVALKILKKELSWEKDTVTRFHREARAMSLLTHPNTVRVFDFGETEDELLFFAMELLEGELLTAKVEREGALDVEEAIRIAHQILRSLAEAHSKGIIHRDLKPDNIYLARVDGHADPVVKVLDFGIAKVVQGERQIDQLETQAGTVFGTPRYMSPEQAQGKTLDPRSDLYSVGVLLYHMLVGRPPFVDDDAVVVMAKHIRERPERIRKAAPDRPIPTSLERAVMRTLDKQPDRRYKSAERLDQRLRSTVHDVRAEVLARKHGRRGIWFALSTLPRVPLAIGGVVVCFALGIAIYVVASSGAASAGSEGGIPLSTLEGIPTSADLDENEAADLAITSDPSGAEVWSGASKLGTTPLSVRAARGRTYQVEIRREGFMPVVAEVEPGHGPLHVELHRDGRPAPRGVLARTHILGTTALARPRLGGVPRTAPTRSR